MTPAAAVAATATAEEEEGAGTAGRRQPARAALSRRRFGWAVAACFTRGSEDLRTKASHAGQVENSVQKFSLQGSPLRLGWHSARVTVTIQIN